MGNKKGVGGKKKHRGKRQDEGDKRLQTLKGEDQEYAKVLERKGGPIMSLRLLTGKTVLGVIRGKHRKRMWMAAKDIVLISYRGFQDDKVDILHKYPYEHSSELVKIGEIPGHFLEDEGTSDTNANTVEAIDDIFGTDMNDIDEWQKKHDSIKHSWGLFIQQGNIKKAKDMKERLDKHILKKPDPNQNIILKQNKNYKNGGGSSKEDNFDFDFSNI